MRRLQIKFPSQIRISGWDFGSSARAMNQAGGKDSLKTYESVRFTQADLMKYMRSTTERKIMSTKTSIKRIALVAVAGLGLSLVTSGTSFAASSAGAITDASDYTAVGTAASSDLTFVTAANNETATLALTVPSGSARTLTDGDGLGTDVWAATDGDSTWVASTGVITDVDSTDDSTGTFTLTPDVAGTYVVTLTTAGNSDTYTIYAAGLAYTTGDGAPAAPATTGKGIAGPANTVTVKATTSASGRRALVTVSGASASLTTGTAGTLASDNLSTLIAAGTGAQDLVIKTPAVGSITVSLFYESATSGIYSATADKTATITVNATAVNGVAASATATITAGSTHAAGGTTDATSITGTKAVGTQVAVIEVVVKDGNSAQVASSVISATVSGPGLLGASDDETAGGVNTTAASGRAVSVTTSGAGDGTGYITVWPDGTAGVSTITVTAGGTTFTKTVTFYGSVASLVVTSINNYIVDSADGVANTDTDAFVAVITAKDANGITVPTATGDYTVSSSTEKVAQSVTNAAVVNLGATAIHNGVSVATTDEVLVVDPTSAKTGAKSLTITHTTSEVAVSVKFNVSLQAASSVSLTFDKDEYAPGELATITVKALDANGVAVSNGAHTLFTGTATSNTSVQGTLPAAGPTFSDGVATYKIYAPLVDGPLQVSATLTAAGNDVASAIASTTVVAKANVVAANGGTSAAIDAANEATDAANAATDAANAAAEAADAATAAAQDAQAAAQDAQAAVAALATQVATLMASMKAQITSLTNLVIKIQKKVKA
jgi:hypothetical protein